MLFNIAVVGATGNVGKEILNILAIRNFPIGEITAIASPKSVGKVLNFKERILTVQSMDSFNFSGTDLVLSSANSTVSKVLATQVVKAGALLIDEAAIFRTDPLIPLVVPEVNKEQLSQVKNKGIIASPNCCVIPLVMILKPLEHIAKIKRVVVNTYQAVSGAGKAAIDELQAAYSDHATLPRVFPRRVVGNVIPQVGTLESSGDTSEELKIITETQKILGETVKIAVTCVRVPVFIGHSLAVNIEFAKPLALPEVMKQLNHAPGIKVTDHVNHFNYATPLDTVGHDEVLVSRIRADLNHSNAINLWITVDNLRKGAALNVVHIAEELIPILQANKRCR